MPDGCFVCPRSLALYLLCNINSCNGNKQLDHKKVVSCFTPSFVTASLAVVDIHANLKPVFSSNQQRGHKWKSGHKWKRKHKSREKLRHPHNCSLCLISVVGIMCVNNTYEINAIKYFNVYFNI